MVIALTALHVVASSRSGRHWNSCSCAVTGARSRRFAFQARRCSTRDFRKERGTRFQVILFGKEFVLTDVMVIAEASVREPITGTSTRLIMCVVGTASDSHAAALQPGRVERSAALFGRRARGALDRHVHQRERGAGSIASITVTGQLRQR